MNILLKLELQCFCCALKLSYTEVYILELLNDLITKGKFL